jgi:Flp pilus assembly pilin Flp
VETVNVKPVRPRVLKPRQFWRDDEGQDLVEYSLLLAFLILTAVALLNSTGKTLYNLLNMSVSKTTSAISTSQS